MKPNRMHMLILEALEHERGVVQIYRTALSCAKNSDLRAEWTDYLEETKEHVEALTAVCEALHLDQEQATPGRAIVKKLGEALVDAMESGLATTPAEDAELVACECVVMAETKDRLNWELLGKLVADGDAPDALEEACEAIDDQEDEHLYHSQGWCRELWLRALGQPAVLPPPAEQKNVKTAMATAQARPRRDAMLDGPGRRHNP